MPREWDAVAYDALPLPHLQWSKRTRDRLILKGDETVLDAGAGTGRDTANLLDMLPEGRVIAVDGSSRMLARLREKVADRGDRVTVVNADITGPLPLVAPVDAVFSVATFHWIHDHDRLFRNLASVLRPGGQLVAECGGSGCVAGVLRAVEQVLGPNASATYFADVDETVARLRAAGFEDIEVTLEPDHHRLEPGPLLLDSLRTLVLGPYLEPLPPADRPDLVRRIAALMPEPVIDYVRLNITARRV
jgi:trans-aconitate 2-methyltransferase